MKILIAAFFDDNFGDMLIRICFEKLLRAALKNLGMAQTDYEIDRMSLKEIDEEKIKSANLLFFAGGGIFGQSYLKLFDYIDPITRIAEANRIPVVFSSTGVNDMSVSDENRHRNIDLLRRSCIRAFSVRENPELFREYAKGSDLEIRPVCDPAVWTKYVYSHEIQKVRDEKMRSPGKTIGVNVVRGGLFRDNDCAWSLKKEEAYLSELKTLLEEAGYTVRFFINGNTLDHNAMGYFAENYAIPETRLISPDTTRELVEAIAGFDAVVAFRMHASIISYALDVPSINIVWNAKIPLFYQNIGYPERAIPLDSATPELIAEKAKSLLGDTNYAADPEYMMSLYRFLYETLCKQLYPDATPPHPIFSFERVAAELSNDSVPPKEDIIDYRTKLQKSEKRYITLFSESKAAQAQIKALKAETGALKKKADEQKREIAELRQNVRSAEQERKEAQAAAEKLQQRLDAINKKFPVRVYKKLRRLTAGLRGLKKQPSTKSRTP